MSLHVRRTRDDERGSMLIVALGILTLLSVLALTFVSIMRLEQTASTNYVDGVKARLIAEGGLDAAAANLKVFAQGESYSDPAAPYIYAQGNYHLPVEQSTARDEPADVPGTRASFAGIIGYSYNKGIDRYKVKVLDTQTQFNLNTRYEVVGSVDECYVRFLDALGVAISRLNPNARTGSGTAGTAGRNPIATARYPKGSPNAWRGGEAIYRFRQSREGQRFNSKSELMEVLFHEDDFNLLQDYVTTRSWFDPQTVTAVPMDGLDNKPWSDVQNKELRSPININLASTEVIAANLAGIAGRFIYLYTGDYDARASRQQDIDNGTTFVSNAAKEETAYGTTGVLVYISPFGYRSGPQPNDPPVISGALKYAGFITDHVKRNCGAHGNCPSNGPFKTFAEWEDFVDRTLTDPLLETTPDPDGGFMFPGHNRTASDPLMLQLDEKALTTPSTVEVRRQQDFRTHFYAAVRAMIKANFNPNPRLSGWNPDDVVYLPCDKGSLLYPADLTAPSSTKAQRQTNEWCLASKGVFEITSLGEVLGDVPEDVAQGPQRIVYSQAKVQGVVQLYETLTHTSQRDFERNGHLQPDATRPLEPPFGGPNDRDVVLSWPVPKIFWDPRAENLGGQQEQHLREATGRFLRADDVNGHLQLGSRIQVANGPDADGNVQLDSRVVEMGGRRFEMLLQDRHIEAAGSTQASNDDALFADTSGGVRNAETQGTAPMVGRPKNGYGWPHGTASQGVAPATRSSTEQLAWRWDAVTPDGYLNSELRETLLWFRASDENSQQLAPHPAPAPDGRLRGKSAATGIGNVTPTLKGGVEFWYKPDFDWTMTGTTFADQRFCGLLGTSHITQNETAYQGGQTQTLGSWTRGTQMFITRNTSGELRVTRLYYECVGPTGHPQEEPRVMDPKAPGSLISFSEYLNRATSDPEYVWPPVELLVIPQPYQNIKFARTDHWVPYNTVRDWKAHEWHHIAAYWNDEAGEVWLWLDGTPYTVGNGGLIARIWPTSPATGRPANARYIPYVRDPRGAPNPPIPADQATPPGPSENPSFVRLNHLTGPTTSPTGVAQPGYEDSLWPKDQVTIGAVKRDQAVVGGLFKHDKDALLPANGTLDDVRFYDGLTPPGNNANPRSFTATRYDAGSEVGYWTNSFDLSRAFQNGVSEISLAGLSFTAYLPRRYGSQTFANGSGAVRVEFELRKKDGTVLNPAHWQDTFSTIRGDSAEIKLTDVAGSTGVPVRVGKEDVLVYRIHFSPAMTAGGVAFATPVLDDISIVYFLPNPAVLLKERVIN